MPLTPEMQLFASPTSPFVRKILVLLTEARLADRVQILPAAGTPLAAGTMPIQHNPLGKIPALLLADSTALYDSRVILRYLDQRFDLGRYPKDGALWPNLAREALVDGIIEAAVSMAYEMRLRPENKQFAAWIDGQWDKIARGLNALEAAPPTGFHAITDIALACALGYIDFRHAPRVWRKDRPHLAAWYETTAQRPSMMATMPAA